MKIIYKNGKVNPRATHLIGMMRFRVKCFQECTTDIGRSILLGQIAYWLIYPEPYATDY